MKTSKKILITAGPTYEKLDPVRFIGNYSSGKMGLALVEACSEEGWDVELVLGPVKTDIKQLLREWADKTNTVNVTHVESAQEMYDACVKVFPEMDAAILCAAVADFTPEKVAEEKMKREGDELVIKLKPTKDIAAALGKMKTDTQKMIGFALETYDEMEHAKQKMKKKNLDFIVLNSLRDEGAGFQVDTNKITILSPTDVTSFPLLSKKECAREIVKMLKKI